MAYKELYNNPSREIMPLRAITVLIKPDTF
jgi:hypothetical protein